MKKHLVFVTIMSLTIGMGLTACGQSEKVSESNQEKQQKEVQGIKEEEATEEQVAVVENTLEESKSEESGYCVVVSGYQFTLPADVSATVNDQGLILTDENVNYQILMTVRDYNFEEKKADESFFSEKVNEAGYEITKDVEITSVADREWAYFNYIDEDGSSMMLTYSAADENHTFANLIVRYGDLSDEEILKELAEILKTAVQTDEPDTTLDDIVEMEAEISGTAVADLEGYASAVDDVELLVGEEVVKVSVPEEFYIMNFCLEEESSSVQSFVSETDTVDVMLTGVEDNYYDSIEEWIKDEIYISEDAENLTKSEIQTTKVGDVTVSYQIASYEEESSYSGDTIMYIVLEAVGELPQGGYIQLEAETSEENGLNFDMVKEFYELK